MNATKNETKHTPGPWLAQRIHLSRGPWAVYGPRHRDGTNYAPLVQLGLMDRPVDEANARLIAAAPDLLEACRESLGYFEQIWPLIADRNDNIMAKLRDAIAKATNSPVSPS